MVTHVRDIGSAHCLTDADIMSHLPVKFTVDESFGAGISGGPLNGSYTLNQLHLHWGSQSDQGSEHTVDGQRFEGNTHLQPATTAVTTICTLKNTFCSTL